MVEQYKEAVQNIENSEEPAGELPDILICFIGCLFYKQYQLSCKHLWHYNILFNSFQDEDWSKWAELFEDEGFEIYEITTVEHIFLVNEAIEGPDKHMLEMREVLDHIKERYYERAERTAEWTAEERNPVIQRWISWLDKLTGPIRRMGVEQALKELENEAEEDEAEGRSLTLRKRPRLMNEDEDQ